MIGSFYFFFLQPIAEVVEASVEDYEESISACVEAAKLWMQVRAFIDPWLFHLPAILDSFSVA